MEEVKAVYTIAEWLLHDGGIPSIMMVLVFVVVFWPKLQHFLNRFNKIKVGSVELTDDVSEVPKENKKIDKSKMPCPYTEQREKTFSEMRGVHESVSGLEKQINGMGGRITQVENRINNVDRRIDQVDGRIDTVDGRINSLVSGMEKMNATMEQFSYEQWQQTFYMKLMPPELRLLAGLRYVSAGKNGKMRKDVLEFAADNCMFYQAITAVDKSLCVPELEVSCRIDGE